MKKDKWRFCTGISLILLIISFTVSAQFRQIYALPSQMRIMQGETALFQVNYPLTVNVSADLNHSINLNAKGSDDFFSRPVFLEPVQLGQATVDFKLLGFIPIKQVQVDILPPLKMVVGGQSIGVVLHSNGVIVVGSSAVLSENDSYVDPAKAAGIQVGDVILEINQRKVNTDREVAEIIDASGNEQKKLELLLRRDNETIAVQVSPVLCQETKRYRIGLFVRDRAVGVGTLTFFDPVTYAYGALGHVITDSDTNQAIECKDGKIVPATVSGIQSGKVGHPGEKIGSFIEADEVIGNIEKNTNFGIYGKVNSETSKYIYSEPLDVASMNQIEPGYAEMLTVVDGQTVERFAINIEKINMQEYPEGKGLVIKVTDERLLAKTGGIVQGMSGSPIIQNGKLVGAVTHVFVHDPTKGYGCFMDWMLMEGGIIPKKNPQEMPQLFTRGFSLSA